jgi:hypothetical protein
LVGFALVFGDLGSTHCDLSMANQGILSHKLHKFVSGLFCEEFHYAELGPSLFCAKGGGACVFSLEVVMAIDQLFNSLCAVCWSG